MHYITQAAYHFSQVFNVDSFVYTNISLAVKDSQMCVQSLACIWEGNWESGREAVTETWTQDEGSLPYPGVSCNQVGETKHCMVGENTAANTSALGVNLTYNVSASPTTRRIQFNAKWGSTSPDSFAFCVPQTICFVFFFLFFDCGTMWTFWCHFFQRFCFPNQ